MQNRHPLGDLDRVDGSICVAHVVFNHFQNTGTTKTLQQLGVFMVLPDCARCKAKPKTSTTSLGMARRSFFEDPTQCSGF